MGAKKIEVREVGPRDGLQNEPARIPAPEKAALVRRLVGCGLRSVEVTACVSPKSVPQMADHREVMEQLGAPPENIDYAALVPNLRGLEAALAGGVTTVCVLASASEEFSRRNTNCTVREGLEKCREIAAAAKPAGKRVRGYVSAAVACPYSGPADPGAAAGVSAELLEMGCDEISLGDTIGAGTPSAVTRLLDAVLREAAADALAGHFHDTWGCAVANVAAALRLGVTKFDSSAGGLGGCPYAPGAAGNLATEDLVRFAEGEGLETGIDLLRLAQTGRWCCGLAGREYAAKAGLAALAAQATGA